MTAAIATRPTTMGEFKKWERLRDEPCILRLGDSPCWGLESWSTECPCHMHERMWAYPVDRALYRDLSGDLVYASRVKLSVPRSQVSWYRGWLARKGYALEILQGKNCAVYVVRNAQQ